MLQLAWVKHQQVQCYECPLMLEEVFIRDWGCWGAQPNHGNAMDVAPVASCT